jgi:hypothetical protein
MSIMENQLQAEIERVKEKATLIEDELRELEYDMDTRALMRAQVRELRGEVLGLEKALDMCAHFVINPRDREIAEPNLLDDQFVDSSLDMLTDIIKGFNA